MATASSVGDDMGVVDSIWAGTDFTRACSVVVVMVIAARSVVAVTGSTIDCRVCACVTLVWRWTRAMMSHKRSRHSTQVTTAGWASAHHWQAKPLR